MGVLRAMRARPADVAADLSDPIGELLRRAGRGDQSAFAELYDALSPLVYGVVLKVVRDPSQAEEVAQEVFVELWRLAARFDGTKGSAKTWAATLAQQPRAGRRSRQDANPYLSRSGGVAECRGRHRQESYSRRNDPATR